MALIGEGRVKIIEKFFQNNTLYLGLWENTKALNIKNSALLSELSKFELSKNEYSRITIAPTDWTIDSGLLTLTLATKTFSPVTQDWNDIRGFFIATTEDNTGDLILTNTYETVQSVLKLNTLDIDLVINI
jgi:hypothetical protein